MTDSLDRNHRPRLLIIGIDGADHRITGRLMRQGLLPNLQALAARGAWGPMRSTIPPITAPAWTTMMTGKNPGKHGVFDFVPMNGQSTERPIASQRRATTVWRGLSDLGYRVGTFNLPVTYPPEELSGFQISGFTAPAFGPASARPEAAFELIRDFGHQFSSILEHTPQTTWDAPGIGARTGLVLTVTRTLLAALPCDVYMTNLNDADWAQHDRLAREMTPGQVETLNLKGSVVAAYRSIDDRIGTLLSEWASDETLTMVVSDHGGGLKDRIVNMDRALMDNGLLAYKPASSEKASGVERGRSRARSALAAWNTLKRVSPAVARLLEPLASRLKPGLQAFQSDVVVDWPRTQAVALGSSAAVRLNVEGRDPGGIVRPEDLPALRSRIRDLLLAIDDPIDGGPVFREVADGSAIYSGPHVADGPDLVPLTSDERCFLATGKGWALIYGKGAAARLDPPWGQHRRAGIFGAAGPGIRAGARLTEHGLEDFAPTILYLLGEAVPSDMDGRPILDAVTDEVREQRPVRVCEPWPDPAAGGSGGYTEEERKRVEDSLRGLGYL